MNDENAIKNDSKNNEEELEPIEEFVETSEDGEELSGSDQVKKLREKLKIALEEKQKYLDSWQRERADFINFKKRSEEEKKEFIKYASERLVDDLTPVLQSFDMAFQNKEAWEKVDKNWRIGVEYIRNHLMKVLEDNGLEEINPIGEVFDPFRDEAIEHITVDEKGKDNTVIEVIQKGYKLNGKVIKPARVKVGEFKE